MIKTITIDDTPIVQCSFVQLCRKKEAAHLYPLYINDYRVLNKKKNNRANKNPSAHLQAIFYKGYTFCANVRARCIYYIYRASTNLPLINEINQNIQNLPPTLQSNCLLSSGHNHPYKTNSTILALDLGSNTGWAIRHSNTTISSGVARFNSKRFEGGGMIYLRFKQWLTQIKNCADSTGTIDAVYFEEVRRHAGTAAAHAYGGFMAHLTTWCEHHDIPYQGVPVGTIKKHITGKGNASKQEVVAAIQAKGFEPEDDNEADALALLDFVLTKEIIGN